VDGLAGLAATKVGFAGFVVVDDFTFGGSGMGVNGAGVSSVGGPAAAFLLNPSKLACGDGARQLQPATAKDNVLMRSVLMHFLLGTHALR